MNASQLRMIYFLAIALLFSLYLVSLSSNIAPPPTEISYSEFKEMVRSGEVAEVTFRDHQVEIILLEEEAAPDGALLPRRLTAQVPDIIDPALWPLLEEHNVVVASDPAEEETASDWILGLLPWILLIGFYLWFWNRMSKNAAGRFGGRDVSDFLQGSANREEKGRPKITFADVAGQESAKSEVSELVDFLKDPTRYRRMGAEQPKGVLLMGPPGTGKTLLARALAGEAGVPFFSISASEFIEMFVGVGASRVRRMFEEAKKRAPAIIFIDELDAVGRVRGAGFGGGHDEREQTLNQILSEMDGFTGHEAVIVLAATNRPDVLDPALLRPGRFDRHVTLDLPDREAREAILKVHTRDIPLADDVELGTIAAGTPGFSGADLKNLANEAAMAAARAGAESVGHKQFDEMRDKLIMGTVRTMAIQPEEQHRLAVHESGHTATAHFLPHADPLYKVTIIPRGRSLGATHMLPEEERHTLPAEYLKDRLAVLLGGYAAEEVVLGTVSSGADDDISQATKLARAMVARWGMSEAIGPMDLRQSEDHPFLGREIAQPRHFSEATTRLVDKAVQELLDEARLRAAGIIASHRSEIERLITALEDKETLTDVNILACLGPAKVTPSVKLVPQGK